ncbi:O-antigen ligase family protein [Pseudolysobacter antarcticus]|uniref:O-antigen ligase family protein n=1 Tax=Pseudolysobacter antarcticus TaxID=2511995 RepID=A0A411HP83_9GAMM|nr:O-antigen ligase family protein [Pseudolysobacter antarcticus]
MIAIDDANRTTLVSLAQRIAWWSVALALLGSAWLVDPFAEAAFDAPKRLCVLLGAALASIALCWCAQSIRWREWSLSSRWIAALAALALLCMIVAAVVSPHPELAWPSLRRLLLIALLVPIGASSMLDGAPGKRMLWVVLLACASTAVISLLQAIGIELPLHVAQIGGRFPTGALLGNEGYVALACAIMAAVCAAVAASAAPRRARIAAAALGVLAILAIVVNHQATSAAALLAALSVIVAVRWQARWLVTLLVATLLIAATTALVAPLRAVTWAKLPVGGIEGFQRLTTYRLGAWVAALDMVSARPLTGYGLGTFAAEAQTHRLAAELDLHERFVQPSGASFVYAHQEYLQLAAEAGIPALLFLLTAIVVLMLGLLRHCWPPDDPERLVLIAIISTGIIEALAWFPLQVPFTATVLLLACGRAWRMVASTAELS